MTEALNYLFLIFDEFIKFVFDDMEFFSGVTFGWVVMNVSLCILTIKSILSLPQGIKITKEKESTDE